MHQAFSTINKRNNNSNEESNIIVNSTTFNNEDLENYIWLNENVEHLAGEYKLHGLPFRSCALKRVEIFESSIKHQRSHFASDHQNSAVVHVSQNSLGYNNFYDMGKSQNSFTASDYEKSDYQNIYYAFEPSVKQTDLDESIEAVMKYFGDDVELGMSSSSSSPMKDAKTTTPADDNLSSKVNSMSVVSTASMTESLKHEPLTVAEHARYVVNTLRPIIEVLRPMVEKLRPSYHQSRSIARRLQLVVEKSQSIAKQKRPNVAQLRLKFEESCPIDKQKRPIVTQSRSKVGQAPAIVEQSSSNFKQTPAIVNQSPPNVQKSTLTIKHSLPEIIEQSQPTLADIQLTVEQLRRRFEPPQTVNKKAVTDKLSKRFSTQEINQYYESLSSVCSTIPTPTKKEETPLQQICDTASSNFSTYKSRVKALVQMFNSQNSLVLSNDKNNRPKYKYINRGLSKMLLPIPAKFGHFPKPPDNSVSILMPSAKTHPVKLESKPILTPLTKATHIPTEITKSSFNPIMSAKFTHITLPSENSTPIPKPLAKSMHIPMPSAKFLSVPQTSVRSSQIPMPLSKSIPIPLTSSNFSSIPTYLAKPSRNSFLSTKSSHIPMPIAKPIRLRQEKSASNSTLLTFKAICMDKVKSPSISKLRGASTPAMVKSVPKLQASKPVPSPTVIKSASKSRTLIPYYCNDGIAPTLSPRKQKQMLYLSRNDCILAENVGCELSVKDKVLLYNKFIADISTAHAQFNAPMQGIEQKVHSKMMRDYDSIAKSVPIPTSDFTEYGSVAVHNLGRKMQRCAALSPTSSSAESEYVSLDVDNTIPKIMRRAPTPPTLKFTKPKYASIDVDNLIGRNKRHAPPTSIPNLTEHEYSSVDVDNPGRNNKSRASLSPTPNFTEPEYTSDAVGNFDRKLNRNRPIPRTPEFRDLELASVAKDRAVGVDRCENMSPCINAVTVGQDLSSNTKTAVYSTTNASAPVTIYSQKRSFKHLLPRKQREEHYEAELYETAEAKRNSDVLSSWLPNDYLEPPKKKHCPEVLAPGMIFGSTHIKRLFYKWLKNMDGVSFDITTTHDQSETIVFTATEHEMESSEKLLEEAFPEIKLRQKEAVMIEQKAADTAAVTIHKPATDVSESSSNGSSRHGSSDSSISGLLTLSQSTPNVTTSPVTIPNNHNMHLENATTPKTAKYSNLILIENHPLLSDFDCESDPEIQKTFNGDVEGSSAPTLALISLTPTVTHPKSSSAPPPMPVISANRNCLTFKQKFKQFADSVLERFNSKRATEHDVQHTVEEKQEHEMRESSFRERNTSRHRGLNSVHILESLHQSTAGNQEVQVPCSKASSSLPSYSIKCQADVQLKEKIFVETIAKHNEKENQLQTQPHQVRPLKTNQEQLQKTQLQQLQLNQVEPQQLQMQQQYTGSPSSIDQGFETASIQIEDSPITHMLISSACYNTLTKQVFPVTELTPHARRAVRRCLAFNFANKITSTPRKKANFPNASGVGRTPPTPFSPIHPSIFSRRRYVVTFTNRRNTL